MFHQTFNDFYLKERQNEYNLNNMNKINNNKNNNNNNMNNNNENINNYIMNDNGININNYRNTTSNYKVCKNENSENRNNEERDNEEYKNNKSMDDENKNNKNDNDKESDSDENKNEESENEENMNGENKYDENKNDKDEERINYSNDDNSLIYGRINIEELNDGDIRKKINNVIDFFFRSIKNRKNKQMNVFMKKINKLIPEIKYDDNEIKENMKILENDYKKCMLNIILNRLKKVISKDELKKMIYDIEVNNIYTYVYYVHNNHRHYLYIDDIGRVYDLKCKYIGVYYQNNKDEINVFLFSNKQKVICFNDYHI